jgi:hypothetical protein
MSSFHRNQGHDVGRLRVNIPGQHDEPDRYIVGVDSPHPWVCLGDLGGLGERVGHRRHVALLSRACAERSDHIGVVVGDLSQVDGHV